MSRTKIITVPITIIDFIPVIFYFLASLIISRKLKRIHKLGCILFYLGTFLTFIGGLCQVVWKLTIAIKKNDIYFLHSQLKFSLSIGFLLQIAGIIVARSNINWKLVIRTLKGLPCVIFTSVAVICCILMMIFIFTLDSNKQRSIWIEEFVNITFQGSVFCCALVGTKYPKYSKTEQDNIALQNLY